MAADLANNPEIVSACEKYSKTTRDQERSSLEEPLIVTKHYFSKFNVKN